ncbi:hypothetical protein HHI36_017742 [Cryptolaemus montrouzieri]|uniref:SCP domain-containing protein n=1 Tax=Cryptolaemus montrouzieri TaxID=559131 RepID=A0ABD2NP34_9CUCU
MFCLANILLLVAILAESAFAACSNGVYENGLSKDEENFVVNKHNELRTLIAQGKVPNQPRGVNLKRMKYSAILAQKAQEIANTCIYGHVDVKGTPWGWVGQNIFQTKRSDYIKGSDWNSVIYGWWDEYKVYKFGSPFRKILDITLRWFGRIQSMLVAVTPTIL